jgi:integrase
MRRPNGSGHITKLSGNRRKPYAIRKIVGWTEKGTPQYNYISYHKTKREAEKALNKYMDDPYTPVKYTLKDVYEEWYALREKDKADNTLSGYRTQWNHLEPLHDMKIQMIDRFVLQKYFDGLVLTDYGLTRIRNLLKFVFEYAVKRGYLPISALNLCRTIELTPKVETREHPHSTLTKEEISYLWEHKDNEIVKIILVYIYTGLRFAELKKLRPSNIHEDYIEIKMAKTEAGNRIVPLSDKVKSLLPISAIPSHSTFIVYFQKILPDHTPHDTRHTFMTLMSEAKVDKGIIRAIVGHKPTDVTEHYTHYSLDVLLEAVNRI